MSILNKPEPVKTLFVAFACAGEAYVKEVPVIRETKKFWLVEPCAETGWSTKIPKEPKLGSSFRTDPESALEHLISTCKCRLEMVHEELWNAKAALAIAKEKAGARCQS